MNRLIDLDNLENWFYKEYDYISNKSYKRILIEIVSNLDSFVKFPQQAILLWDGCTRSKGSEKHLYPKDLEDILRNNSAQIDQRSNGPAITAYFLAGGIRPQKSGKNHGWSIHHLYNNKFPYLNQSNTLHAVKHPQHFTQSAGLVAIHPIADATFEEFAIFAWYIRAKAYQMFKYDPDKAFDDSSGEYGFAKNAQYQILYPSSQTEKIEVKNSNTLPLKPITTNHTNNDYFKTYFAKKVSIIFFLVNYWEFAQPNTHKINSINQVNVTKQYVLQAYITNTKKLFVNKENIQALKYIIETTKQNNLIKIATEIYNLETAQNS